MVELAPMGLVPAGWDTVRLGQVTQKIGSGATPTGGKKVYLRSRIHSALIRSQCVHDRRFDSSAVSFITDNDAARLQNAKVMADDVLLNITGDGITFGRSSKVPHDILPACVNQHVAIIRPNPTRLDAGFLLSYLTHPQIRHYIESFNAGGSRRAITKGHIENFVVPLPPLHEQRAIASILGALDDKIDLNRRMNKTLETMARAIFKDWFADFGPTRAKMEGRAPYLSPDVWSLFPDRLDEEGRPEGWRYIDLGDAAEIARGLSYKGSGLATADTGKPLHNLNSVFEGGGYKYEGIKFYKGAFLPRHGVRPGDRMRWVAIARAASLRGPRNGSADGVSLSVWSGWSSSKSFIRHASRNRGQRLSAGRSILLHNIARQQPHRKGRYADGGHGSIDRAVR